MKLKQIITPLSLAILMSMSFNVAKASAQEHVKSGIKYKSKIVDDIYIMNVYKNKIEDEKEKEQKAEEKSKSEKEEKSKSNESSKQVEHKSSEQSKHTAEPTFSNPTPVGKLRLANHNHDKQTMIEHINRFYAGTPMAGTGNSAVDAGIKYNVDPYAIAAISRTESGRGVHCVNSNNPFGRKAIGGGYMSWGSFSEALYDEASYLARVYLNKGLTNWDSIGHVYCETGGWASTNRAYQNQIRDN